MSEGYRGRRVLVTGAGGFLGRVLCHHLVQAGALLIGLGRSPLHPSTVCPPLAPPSDYVVLDLDDPRLPSTLAELSVDLVFHLAGRAENTSSLQSPTVDVSHNLMATVQLLDALRAIHFTGHLVFASSAAVYGLPTQLPITENAPTRPITPYGMSKLAAEGYVRVFGEAYNFSMTIARLFSLYGPGQRKQVIYDLCQKAMGTQGPIPLWGDGNEVRDFTYVDDAARILLRLGEDHRAQGQLFNICSGQGLMIADVARQVMQHLGEDPSRLRFGGAQRTGDVTAWIGCNRKVNALDITPSQSFQTGLAATIAWFRKDSKS